MPFGMVRIEARPDALCSATEHPTPTWVSIRNVDRIIKRKTQRGSCACAGEPPCAKLKARVCRTAPAAQSAVLSGSSSHPFSGMARAARYALNQNGSSVRKIHQLSHSINDSERCVLGFLFDEKLAFDEFSSQQISTEHSTCELFNREGSIRARRFFTRRAMQRTLNWVLLMRKAAAQTRYTQGRAPRPVSGNAGCHRLDSR